MPASKPVFLVWITLTFVCEGAHFVIFPALASAIYGPSLGAKVYSILFIGMAIAANIGIIAIDVILPQLGWLAVFLFFGALTVASTLLLLFFKEGRPPRK